MKSVDNLFDKHRYQAQQPDQWRLTMIMNKLPSSLWAIIRDILIDTKIYGSLIKLRRVFRSDLNKNYKKDLLFYNKLEVAGNLVYDVGANFGVISEKLVDAGARVIAFEPNHDLLRIITARCSQPNRLNVICAACNNEAGAGTLLIPYFSGQASFLTGWTDSEVLSEKIVPRVPLREIMDITGLPHYIKIDVEGFEYEVISGLSTQVPVLSFEFHSDHRISDLRRCLDKYRELGEIWVNCVLERDATWLFNEPIQLVDTEEFVNLIISRVRSKSARYGEVFCAPKKQQLNFSWS